MIEENIQAIIVLESNLISLIQLKTKLTEICSFLIRLNNFIIKAQGQTQHGINMYQLNLTYMSYLHSNNKNIETFFYL
jgi:hypothetical protein